MLLFNEHGIKQIPFFSYFNTSNVTIQQIAFLCCTKVKRNFNTSNVTIQPLYRFYKCANS